MTETDSTTDVIGYCIHFIGLSRDNRLCLSHCLCEHIVTMIDRLLQANNYQTMAISLTNVKEKGYNEHSATTNFYSFATILFISAGPAESNAVNQFIWCWQFFLEVHFDAYGFSYYCCHSYNYEFEFQVLRAYLSLTSFHVNTWQLYMK